VRVLQSVTPSREQLPIVLNDRPGVGVVRGAAGSGKTTTALLRLKQLCVVRRSRRARLDQVEPVRVLVLTYNRSLAGYVSALAAEQVQQASDLDLTVCTFGKWASDVLNLTSLIDDDGRVRLLSRLGISLSLSSAFIAEEVDYAFGRFPSGVIQQYLQRDRDGRGSMPRVDKQRMLTEVLEPYLAWKQQTGVIDWNDAAELLLTIR
jgi:superfamily I DNA/RNA helicase